MLRKDVTFLLVEDDDVDIMVLKHSFRRMNIANPIVVARDGVEALEVLRGTGRDEALAKPYIVLLDLNMPRMNGIEFLQEIRKDPDLTRTIVFVLTTSEDERDKLRAYNHHIAGYIVKSDASGQLFISALEMLDRYWRVVELPPS